jgi:hypothetical protein
MILQKDAKTDLTKRSQRSQRGIAATTEGDRVGVVALVSDRQADTACRTPGQNRASFGSKPLSEIIPPNILRLNRLMAH